MVPGAPGRAAPPAQPAGAHYHENFDRILDLLILNFPGWPLIRAQTMLVSDGQAPPPALSTIQPPPPAHAQPTHGHPRPGTPQAAAAPPGPPLPALQPPPGAPRGVCALGRAEARSCCFQSIIHGEAEPRAGLTAARWRGCPRLLSPPASLPSKTGPSWKHSAY